MSKHHLSSPKRRKQNNRPRRIRLQKSHKLPLNLKNLKKTRRRKLRMRTKMTMIDSLVKDPTSNLTFPQRISLVTSPLKKLSLSLVSKPQSKVKSRVALVISLSRRRMGSRRAACPSRTIWGWGVMSSATRASTRTAAGSPPARRTTAAMEPQLARHSAPPDTS